MATSATSYFVQTTLKVTLPNEEDGFDLACRYKKAKMRDSDWIRPLKSPCFSDLMLLVCMIAFRIFFSFLPPWFLSCLDLSLLGIFVIRVRHILLKAESHLSLAQKQERVADLELLQRINRLRREQLPSLWNRLRYDVEGNERFYFWSPSYSQRLSSFGLF